MALSINDLWLLAVLLGVLAGPFLNKRIEHNLEVFLLAMGAAAVTIAGRWNLGLLEEAATEPLLKGMVPAVLAAGLLFHYARRYVDVGTQGLLRVMPLKVLVFLSIVVLGLLSSVITAIVASLLLVEGLNVLPLERKGRIPVVVMACFAIGLGAALTPIGEPLTTITLSKLKGEPYNADFGFFMEHLGVYILPGVLAFGLLALPFAKRQPAKDAAATAKATEARKRAGHADGSLRDVFIRALKVYLFIVGLMFLGAGVQVLIEKYLVHVPAKPLYWINMTSSVLDNATLAAAEISPRMGLDQIKTALMGLLLSGGMLIPGNIPNIVAASKLGITSREWARVGVPVGLAAMVVYFIWLEYL